jgi:hypothetical protein
MARVLPGREHDVAIVAVTLTSLSPARLIAWANAIEQLKHGPTVQSVRRLSSRPRADEFSTLNLPPDDLQDLRRCGPGACGVKLSANEMGQIRDEIRVAGADWAARANAVFRDIARDRILAYLAGGLAALAPYADGRSEPARAPAFEKLIEHSPFLRHLPALLARLGPPAAGLGDGDFTYWSVEQFGAKNVVTATHTIITTSDDPARPAVLVAGKQIFATHYAVASLNVTALVRRPGGAGAPYYLVVVNRTSVDDIEGLLGGFVRHSVESRMRRDTPGLVAALRERMESGPPR